jgi:hypothetical protein
MVNSADVAVWSAGIGLMWRLKTQARVAHTQKSCRTGARESHAQEHPPAHGGAFCVGLGVLGRDLTVVIESIRWTGNLPNRADVAARGGAETARGQMATTSKGAW